MQRPFKGLCRGNQKKEGMAPSFKIVNKLGRQDEPMKVQKKFKEKIH